MADYKVVGIGLRDEWDYDFIKQWMDREKQIAAVKKLIVDIPNCDYVQERFLHEEGIGPGQISGIINITSDNIQTYVNIKYNKDTLSYLLNKPSEVINRLIEIVASGIQKGLEETLEKQESVRKYNSPFFDTGHKELDEMQKAIKEELDSDKDLSHLFTLQEKNHMVDYFARGYLEQMLYAGKDI